MINIKRTIIPVGQGLFCKETFYDGEQPCLHVIYDCGAKPCTKLSSLLESAYLGVEYKKNAKLPPVGNLLTQRIKQVFPWRDEKIDLLFISHFHEDHVCGFIELLNNRQVKNLVMPQLSRELLVEAIVNNYVQMDSVDEEDTINAANQMLINLFFRHSLQRVDNICIVESSQERVERLVPVDINDIPNHISNSSINYQEIWEYVPYCVKDQNFANDLYKKILSDQLFSKYFTNFNEQSLNKFIRAISKGKGLAHMKELYSNFEKNDKQNEYSMPVYSGALVPVNQVETIYCNVRTLSQLNRNCASCIKTAGCLYTGDFNASKYIYGLHKYLSMDNRWDKIGVVQVPHHGALSSHSAALYNKCRYGVISAGKLNQYHHPNWDVCDDIVTNGLDCIVVNEFASTAFNQIITINI